MDKEALQEKKLQTLLRMKKLLEARNSKLREERLNRPGAGLAALLEGELERAELTLSAQDVVNKLQDTAEDLAKMSVEQLLPLADEMKGEFGPEAAQKFEDVVGGALESALQAVRDAREQVNNAVLRMQGKLSDEDVATPDTDMADANNSIGDTGSEEDFDLAGETGEDEFAGAPAASGPEEEPLGRAKKESIDYSVKKKSSALVYEKALLDAFVELVQENKIDSLIVEVISDKYGILEEELLELYSRAEFILKEVAKNAGNTEALLETFNFMERQQLDEFLPLIAGLAGRALLGAAGAGAKALGGAALRSLGGAASGLAKNAVGGLAKNALGGLAKSSLGKTLSGALSGDDDSKPATPQTNKATTPASAMHNQNVKRTLANNQTIRNLATKLKVQPNDLADFGATLLTQSKDETTSKKKLKEHRIVENIAPMQRDDAMRIVKERIKNARVSKDLAVRETFSADIGLTTPRSVVLQLCNKYGDPRAWSVAQTNEGSYYVLSSPIPETEKAKTLETQIVSLEEEINGIREKHADVQAEYKLPQEIKIESFRKQLGEYQTGYRHQVAKWLSLDEASALLSLAQSLAPRKKDK